MKNAAAAAITITISTRRSRARNMVASCGQLKHTACRTEPLRSAMTIGINNRQSSNQQSPIRSPQFLTAGSRADDKKRLRALDHRVGQRRVGRLVREILFTGK